ncbi:hypothetical protein GALMADRAFT_1230796 [Galerina marginata CBS 339.88]|uniref:Uncharacterized protein n=1 Tax=Galerina marginata (strain CBS 339.88) TaxID=685588 RepID=A0A067TH73_GALM3|nr:hypothetical protein GALMADRAFT_1230796 [Galerina marginata CBS 339.88]
MGPRPVQPPSMVYSPEHPQPSHLSPRPSPSRSSMAIQSMVGPPKRPQPPYTAARLRSGYSPRTTSGMEYPADPRQPNLSTRQRPRRLTGTPSMDHFPNSPQPSHHVAETRRRNNSVAVSPNSPNFLHRGPHPYLPASRPRRSSPSVAISAPKFDSPLNHGTSLSASTMPPPSYNLIPTHLRSINSPPRFNYQPTSRLLTVNSPNHQYNIGEHNFMRAHTQPHVTGENGRPKDDLDFSGLNFGVRNYLNP